MYSLFIFRMGAFEAEGINFRSTFLTRPRNLLGCDAQKLCGFFSYQDALLYFLAKGFANFRFLRIPNCAYTAFRKSHFDGNFLIYFVEDMRCLLMFPAVIIEVSPFSAFIARCGEIDIFPCALSRS